MKQETIGWHWHQLDHMQIICTSLQTDNCTAPYHSILDRLDAVPINSVKALGVNQSGLSRTVGHA